MKRNIWNLTPVVIVLIILVIMQTVYIAVLDWRYAIVAAVVSLGVLVFAFIRLRMLNKDIRKYIYKHHPMNWDKKNRHALQTV